MLISLKREQIVHFTKRVSSKTAISGLNRLKCWFHVNRSALEGGDDIFGQVLGWLPRIFTRGVVLPVDEVLRLGSFCTFRNDTLDFVDAHYNWLYLRTVFQITGTIANIIK